MGCHLYQAIIWIPLFTNLSQKTDETEWVLAERRREVECVLSVSQLLYSHRPKNNAAFVLLFG